MADEPNDPTNPPGGVAAPGDGAPPGKDVSPEPVVAREEGADSPPQAPPEPPPPKPDSSEFDRQRMQQRINKLTARLSAAQAEVSAAKAAGKPADEDAVARLVEERAAALADQRVEERFVQRRFNEETQRVLREGEESFGKETFQKSVNEFLKLRDPTDVEEQGQYNAFIAALIETGAAPKLIQMLSGDLTEASRLMRLSPLRQGLALAKLVDKEPEAVSQAPKPIKPIGSVGRSHEALKTEESAGDRLDMATWMKRRSEHIAGVNKESGRRML